MNTQNNPQLKNNRLDMTKKSLYMLQKALIMFTKSIKSDKHDLLQHNYRSYINQMNNSSIVLPTSSIKLKVNIHGVYAIPEQWKSTDQANPGLFTYVVKSSVVKFEKGKVQPRKLTEKEIKEQEQKSKKGGKKEAKKEETVEDEALKKQEEELERKKQQEWDKLSEEEKLYQGSEDPFKAISLQFEEKEVEAEVSGKQYTILEEHIRYDKGEWIYLYKHCTASEQELTKLKKTKPKTLVNANDLNPVIMRAWMDLQSLNSQQLKQKTLRCAVVQINKTSESPQPNLEHSYIKITFGFDKTLQQKQDEYSVNSFIADPPAEEKLVASERCIQQLKEELTLGIQSLAMEYSAMFIKEMSIYDQHKNQHIFINFKKNQISKRRQQFLYDFNISGKYKILKDRIKRVIVHLCENNFSHILNAKSFTGVTYDSKDQFYSYIYSFLVVNYKQTLQKLIFQKLQSLHKVNVLTPLSQQTFTEKYLQSYKSETAVERLNRQVSEYEKLFEYSYGEKIYLNSLAKNKNDVNVKYYYGLYCIKHQLKNAEGVLPLIQAYLQYNKKNEEVLVQYLLLLVATQSEQNCFKAWVILRALMHENSTNVTYMLLSSMVFEFYLKDQHLALKYLTLAQRQTLRNQNLISEVGKHQENPNPNQLPTLLALPTFEDCLPNKDELWIPIIELLIKYKLFTVANHLKNKISNPKQKAIIMLNVYESYGATDQVSAIQKVIDIYRQTKSSQILQTIIQLYFRQNNYQQLQKYLKIALLSETQTRLESLIRLSVVYLLQQQFGNAKACIVKYLEQSSVRSGLSWNILGEAELRLGNRTQATQCFRHANLCDINNPKPWLYLTLSYAQGAQFIVCSQCYNNYIRRRNQSPNSKIQMEILKTLQQQKPQNSYTQRIQKQLINRMENSSLTQQNIS